jgi:hypothetical protein
MKGFIQRLALLIHWIGFLMVPITLVINLMDANLRPDTIENVLTAVTGFAILWVLKWLISGNKSFFPWRS